MIYAVLMLIALSALAVDWFRHSLQIPLFLLAIILTAVFFALDVTTPLTISL